MVTDVLAVQERDRLADMLMLALQERARQGQQDRCPPTDDEPYVIFESGPWRKPEDEMVEILTLIATRLRSQT